MSQDTLYDIFISYRRDGGYVTAKHLYDLLSRDGYAVSFDIDTLRNGDFDTELLKRIDECTDFILVLNKEAFDRTLDPDFPKERDWLRNELAHALAKGKNIIPVMLNGFTEFPDDLPADIAKVAKKNGPKYDQYYFDDFYRKLKEVFLDSKPSATTNQTGEGLCAVKIRSNLPFDFFIDGAYFDRVETEDLFVTSIAPGEYIFRFVSIYDGGIDSVELKHVVGKDSPILEIDLESVEKRREAKEEAALEAIARKFGDEGGYSFSCGLCEVEVNGLYGFVDADCKEVIPCIYDYVSGFSKVTGVCIVSQRENYGVIDTKGKVLIPVKFGRIETLYEVPDSLYLRCMKDGKCGLWSLPDGEARLPFAYDGISNFMGNRCIVRRGKEYGIFDAEKKEWLLEFGEYDGASLYADYAIVEKNEKYFLCIFGNSVKADAYDDVKPFSEDKAAVKKDGHWGFVDKEGKIVIPIRLDDCNSFFSGLAPVCVKGKWGYMTHSGKLEIPLRYDSASCIVDGRAIVGVNGKKGLINRKGEIIYPPTDGVEFWVDVNAAKSVKLPILLIEGDVTKVIDYYGNAKEVSVMKYDEGTYIADEGVFSREFFNEIESVDYYNSLYRTSPGTFDAEDETNDDAFFLDDIDDETCSALSASSIEKLSDIVLDRLKAVAADTKDVTLDADLHTGLSLERDDLEEFVMMLEETFGIELESNRILSAQTGRDIEDYLSEKLKDEDVAQVVLPEPQPAAPEMKIRVGQSVTVDNIDAVVVRIVDGKCLLLTKECENLAFEDIKPGGTVLKTIFGKGPAKLDTAQGKNGMGNCRAMKSISGWRKRFPILDWCARLGAEWFIPSCIEWDEVTADCNLNEYFGSDIKEELYWTSNASPYDDTDAYLNRMTAFRGNPHSVRAMRWIGYDELCLLTGLSDR